MRKLVFCLCLSVPLWPALRPCAQAAGGGPERGPDGRAVEALDAALEALGGLERLGRITSIMVRAKGVEHRSAEVQGYEPGRQTNSEHDETLVVFPAQERLVFEHRTGRHDGTVRWRRWDYAGDQRVVADFINRAVYPRRGASTAAERARAARRVPHLLLVEARRHPAALTLSSASETYDGRPHAVVSYRPPGEKVEIKLFFDSATRLPSKYEYVMEYPGLGDVVAEYIYSDYRPHPALGRFPAAHSIRLAGEVARAVTVTEAAVDSPRAEELTRLPDDLAAQLTHAGVVTPAAPGVYVVGVGSFTLMFVEFREFVLAIEAPAPGPSLDAIPADNQPGSSALTEEYIKKIKETVPRKPIRYVAVTHFHNDHAGGARAFIAEGATILTTPGNRPVFERMAAARYALNPDRLAREPRPLRIETFEARRVISDGDRTVELLSVGPNPHTHESVVVYVPRERILFQGDLFYFDGAMTFPPRDRHTVMPFFARWLKRNRLAPARIYDVHGRGFATMEQVEEVLRARRR